MKIFRRIASLLLAVMLLGGGLAAAAEEGGVTMPEALKGIELLKEGDSGEAVRALQERLLALNYKDAETDGVYGPGTAKAVKRFQQRNDLLETGMADAVTLELLFSEQAVAEWSPSPVNPDEPAEGGFVYELFDAYFTDEEALPDSAPSYAFAAPMATGMPVPNAYMGLAASERARGLGWDVPFDTNEYSAFADNRFQSTAVSPLSTFAAEVDTSSYTQLRRMILSGGRVTPDMVRVEELLNYFHYDYAEPTDGAPFGVTMEVSDCPWNPDTKLLLIGLQAKKAETENAAGQNLVFLIDTSGSMDGSDRLDLVKRAFLLLLDTLSPADTVSIVAYASQDRVVIEGVPAGEKTRIMEAITELEARGATNGTAGLTRAYEVAERHLVPGGVNRILLATDGDINVGPSSEGDLARLVMEKKEAGVTLTVMGFGYGNLKDNKLNALAKYGDGECWYIDTVHEARRALVTEAGGRFETVAEDVKLQLDFNPAVIKGYRLIGYEDRVLAPEDFHDDNVEGGFIGSGHRVTALYEIVPADSAFEVPAASSRYTAPAPAGDSAEWLTLSIRAKKPGSAASDLWSYPLTAEQAAAPATDNLRFAAAVAEVSMLLRDSEFRGSASYDSALELLRGCGSLIGDSFKEEFLYMVTLLAREQ